RGERACVGARATRAACASSQGEHTVAASCLRLAVSADPYREDLLRALMQALAAGGSPVGALLVYRQFRDQLRREMAAAPAEETTALFQRLRDETRARAQGEGGRARGEERRGKGGRGRADGHEPL